MLIYSCIFYKLTNIDQHWLVNLRYAPAANPKLLLTFMGISSVHMRNEKRCDVFILWKIVEV